jgi:hypothetical protein
MYNCPIENTPYNMFFWTPQKPERNGRTKFTGSCGVALGSIIIVKPLHI